MIWIPSDTESWEPATVVSNDTKSVTVRLKSGKEVKIPGALTKFDTIPQGSLEEQCENLVDLESYSEGIILHHTKKRFSEDIIYTFVGTILIALNPYKPLDIYTEKIIDKIYNNTKKNENVQPHVFSIGAVAVNNMRNDGKDQSVLISGESGAGKTEATKKILQFISTVCASTASRIGASIENQILDSNPILESFGNAKTIRNNNSSRFGKYMEVNFDKRNNIKGCNITAYLLEKSRVVKQGLGERNYHVFYMLLSGANKDMKKDYFLKPADQFYYLAQSGCMEIDRRSDLKEFEEMMFAMNSLAVDLTMQNHIFQSLAGILHLGNLTFATSREIEGGSKVASPADCRRVAQLLGMNPDGLEKALCNKDAVVNGDIMSIPISPEKAVDQRDTLAKYVYGKLFDHIIKKVNGSLFRGKVGHNIGVLDIFGFEVFKVNSFEQLCINYCNERLQTFFNEIIFEGEMKTYVAEGLPCDDISYQDNMGCVRLIDMARVGIFAVLDEEILVPKGSDEKFVSKLNTAYDENPGTKSPYFIRNKRSPLEFMVRHFAGDVGYIATDFMEKNKDALAESLLTQLQQSTIPLLVTVEDTTATAEGGKGKKKGTKLTIAAKFKQDLDGLMTALRATVPHFIRCVKPNNDQAPNKFDPNLALNQLKYSGLFEAIRIRKAGYAVRMPNDQFIKRYKHCIVKVAPEIKSDPIAYCTALLTELTKMIPAESSTANSAAKGKAAAPATSAPISGRVWVVGKTRVFIRTQQFKNQLEIVREKNSSNAAVPFQRIVRGFIIRARFFALMGERRKRLEEDRKREASERTLMEKEEKISAKIEDVFRNDVSLQRRLAEAKAERTRQEQKRISTLKNNAAVKIQRIIRGKLGRKSGRIFMCERMFELALLQRDETMIRRAIMMPRLFNVTSKLIKLYTTHAKAVILEVLNESFVTNQLSDAIEVGSVELLKDAIKLAEESHMPYLERLHDARLKLDNVLLLKSVVSSLSGVMAKCVTVPKLLAKVDTINLLIKQSTELGLAGEFAVQDAALRLTKIKNLIKLRDSMRFAVEICSPSKMISMMQEREKLLRIYGPDLLLEEANAIEGMFRMLSYQQHLDEAPDTKEDVSSTSNSNNNTPIKKAKPENTKSPKAKVEDSHEEKEVPESGEEENRDGDGNNEDDQNNDNISASEFKQVKNAIEAADESDGANDVNAKDDNSSCVNNKMKSKLESMRTGNDVYLPPFVRKPLEDMRSSKSHQELNEAIASLVKLVPDETKRKFYVRVFKWVIAFAVWKYPKVNNNNDPSANYIEFTKRAHHFEDSLKHQKMLTKSTRELSISKPSPADNNNSNSNNNNNNSNSTPLKTPVKTPNKRGSTDILTVLINNKMKAAGLPTPDQQQQQHNKKHNSMSMLFGGMVEEVQGGDDNKNNNAPVKNAPVTPGSKGKAGAATSSKTNLAIAAKNAATSSATPNKTFSPIKVSNSHDTSGGLTLSPAQRHIIDDWNKANNASSNAGAANRSQSPAKPAASSTATTSVIPFSQRQSKSTVAVHEILKKGKKHNYEYITHKTDKLLEKTINDYGKIKTKLKPSSTFSG